MAEDNTVYYPVQAKEIGEAYYLDCEKTRVAVVPYPERPGSYQVAPDYRPLREWVAQGGVIAEPKYDCLGYAKRNKIAEVQIYAYNLMEQNEPDYSRKAREARMLLATPATSNRSDYNKGLYDTKVLMHADAVCQEVSSMNTIDVVNSVDVPNLDWPK